MNQANNDKCINLTIFQQYIGKLIYLVYEIQTNIALVVDLLSQYNLDLKVDNSRIVKQMLHYLKRIINLEII